jgi:hypothetical protein
MRRAIKRFLGSPRISLRNFVLLLLSLLFLGLLITFSIIKIVESTGKYNTRYYDPRDFQREDMIKKKLEKK